MAKLHELLAAEGSLAAAYNAVNEQALKTFGTPELFTRITATKQHLDAGKTHLDVAETKDNATTVDDQLGASFGRAFTNYVDLLVQKDRTNQEARADVIVNGQTLLEGIPGTALLTLESQLAKKRAELEKIPTLQPGPEWLADATNGLWKTAEPQVSFSTQKTIRPIVLVPATEHHPAQVDKISEDVPVARVEKVVWSGMWTATEKADAISRLDALLVAVKKARQRANRTDVVKLRVGQTVADFILNGPAAEALTGTDEEE